MNPKALDFSDAPKKVKYYIAISYKDEEYVSATKEDYEYNVNELRAKLMSDDIKSFYMQCINYDSSMPEIVIFRKNILNNSIITIKYLK